MSRSRNLCHSVVDQVIEDMTRGNVSSPLPSQSGSAKVHNTSCTAVHHILQYLSVCDVFTLVGRNCVIVHKLEQNDGFDCITASLKEQNRLFEQALLTMINLRQLHARESPPELQLARATSVSPVAVGEYLLKFGRHNLIQSEKRDQWSTKQFDQFHAEQPFELREALETHSL